MERLGVQQDRRKSSVVNQEQQHCPIPFSPINRDDDRAACIIGLAKLSHEGTES